MIVIIIRRGPRRIIYWIPRSGFTLATITLQVARPGTRRHVVKCDNGLTCSRVYYVRVNVDRTRGSAGEDRDRGYRDDGRDG